MTEFTEGFNTYRVYPITMKDKNADEIIGKIEAYRITQRTTTVEVTDMRKIEAMIYAMADKFLELEELTELKEEIRMTRLGQMLREEYWK